MSVIVLNADYTYLHTVSWRRAINLMLKGKVEVLQYTQHMINGFCQSIALPQVVRLIKFVRQVYKNKVPLHRKNIFVRDEFICQYCGEPCRKHPTVDHIVPKSRAGSMTWVNTVTACRRCNQKKGNRTPREAGLTLLRQPFRPTINEFAQMKMRSLGLDSLLMDLLSQSQAHS